MDVQNRFDYRELMPDVWESLASQRMFEPAVGRLAVDEEMKRG